MDVIKANSHFEEDNPNFHPIDSKMAQKGGNITEY
jgi:hypothetical protein